MKVCYRSPSEGPDSFVDSAHRIIEELRRTPKPSIVSRCRPERFAPLFACNVRRRTDAIGITRSL
jgi:hypothetical protein